MKAKDLMILIEEHLKPEMTLKDAALVLNAIKGKEPVTGIKGLPVLDSTGRMIGFLSIGDILKAVFPAYMSLMNLGDFAWDGMVEDMAKKAKDRKVSEVMTIRVISVNEDAPLMECVDHMLRNNIKKLPVTDKAGKVTGILYEKEIFSAIVRAMDGNK